MYVFLPIFAFVMENEGITVGLRQTTRTLNQISLIDDFGNLLSPFTCFLTPTLLFSCQSEEVPPPQPAPTPQPPAPEPTEPAPQSASSTNQYNMTQEQLIRQQLLAKQNQLLAKQKQLLELQQKKIELELEQTKAQLVGLLLSYLG